MDKVEVSRSWRALLPPIFCCLCLLVALLAVFLPIRQNGFINYDDDVYVSDNLHVQDGVTRAGLTWAIHTFAAGNWHPLTWVSHMIDCQVFGLKPAGHHLVSLALHTATTLLLFLLLRRMTQACWRSFFVAALFGLHPLHVESVAWIAERKDVLSGLFFVLTLWAYSRYAEQSAVNALNPVQQCQGSKARKSLRGARFYTLALLLFTLGLMSKAMLVTTPFVLLLLDFWPLRRWWSGSLATQDPSASPLAVPQFMPAKFAALRLNLSLLFEKLPFLVLAIGASVLTWTAQRQGGAVESLSRLPLLSRLVNALVAYARYLLKIFWPTNLAVFYPSPVHWPWTSVAAAGLLLVTLSVLFWLLRRHQSYVLVGWLWFIGMLVPVIGLVQVGYQSLADRYTYLPSIGLFLILVWGSHEFVAKHWPGRLKLLASVGICVLLACATLARVQLGYWRNSGTLFQHALAVTHRNPIAELHLGSFQLLHGGKIAEAVQHLKAAIEIEPRLPEPYDALGTALYLEGRRQEAIQQFERALLLKPDYAVAQFNLAVALQAEGRLAEALQHFARALAAKPDYAEACSGMGVVFAAEGRFEAAIDRFQQALALNPNLATVHYNLGLVLLKLGRRQEAIAEFAQALALRPNYPEAQRQLGNLNH